VNISVFPSVVKGKELIMKEVSLFIPCTVDLFAPRIGESVVNVLRRLGVNPVYHEGRPAAASRP